MAIGRGLSISLSAQPRYRTALALLSNLNIDGANSSRVSVPGSLLYPVTITTPVRDTKVIALLTPGAVPIDSANLGFAFIQVNMSGRSRRRIGATTRADVFRTAWRHRDSVYLRSFDFFIFVPVPIEFAPGVLSEDDIRIWT
jgi:hypothetical protein